MPSGSTFSHRLRRWSYQTALFVAAMLVMLVCLEAGFRVARRGDIGFDQLGWEAPGAKKNPGKIYEKTAEFEFTATINKLGFRGPDVAPEKARGTKRILILGDSFTFGWGVNDDQVFTARLEKHLNQTGQRYEIINASGGSLSPLVYYVRLKNGYLQLKPDLVILFLNYADLREDYLFRRNIVRDDKGEISDVNPLYLDGKLDFWRWLRRQSEFASYSYNKLNRTFRRIHVLGFWTYLKLKLRGERTRDAMFESKQPASAAMNAIEYDTYFMLRDPAPVDEIQKYLAATTQTIGEIHELLQKRGARLLLAFLPNGAQVGPEQWSQGRRMWGFEQGRVYENPALLKDIASYAKSHGIRFVNLLPAFRQNDARPLFFAHDGHLRPAGHAILANGLLSSDDFRLALNLPWKRMRK